MLPAAHRTDAQTLPRPCNSAASAAALLRSGELGRRLVRLSQLAAAAHMAQTAEQIVRQSRESRA